MSSAFSRTRPVRSWESRVHYGNNNNKYYKSADDFSDDKRFDHHGALSLSFSIDQKNTQQTEVLDAATRWKTSFGSFLFCSWQIMNDSARFFLSYYKTKLLPYRYVYKKKTENVHPCGRSFTVCLVTYFFSKHVRGGPVLSYCYKYVCLVLRPHWYTRPCINQLFCFHLPLFFSSYIHPSGRGYISLRRSRWFFPFKKKKKKKTIERKNGMPAKVGIGGRQASRSITVRRIDSGQWLSLPFNGYSCR